MGTPQDEISTPEGHEERLEFGQQLTVHATTLGAGFRRLMATRLSTALRGVGQDLERVVVRFEDLNGPKGGVDTACRIQLTVRGRPVLVAEARADGEARAFRLALPRLATALARQRGRDRSHSRASLRLQHVM